MKKVLSCLKLARIVSSLPLILLLVACVPAEVEPSLGGQVTIDGQSLPTPFPSPTAPPPPITLTALEQAPASGVPTTDNQYLPPAVTPTPVPPPPGVVYNLDGELWRVGGDWQPALLAAEAGDVLSSDGQRALRVVDNDIWLIYLPTGQRFNLTGNSGRRHCCPRFWSTRPDTIVFGSWPLDEELGPSTGYLSSARFDLSEYRVLDEEIPSNAEAAPGPDGQTIAYDRAGTAWLHDSDNGPRTLDPAAYGLSNIARIGGPAWSPDGRRLAWTVAINDPGWRIAVVVFDLHAGIANLFHPYENMGRGGWFPPPAWSPDGRWLAFVTEDVDPALRGVWVVEVDSEQEF